MDVLPTNVSVDAPLRVRRLIEPLFSDLQGPPIATLTVRRRGLRRWTFRFGSASLSTPLDIGLGECLIELNDLVAHAAENTSLPIHAGCVTAPDGSARAVALIGSSGSGKTTLTATAVARGWGYVGDEVCAVYPDRRVLPYHRPLGLLPDAAARFGLPPVARGWSIAPTPGSRLGRLTRSAELAAVVFLARQPSEHDHSAPKAAPLSAAESLVQLSHHTLARGPSTSLMFRRAEEVARTVPAYRLEYTDADDTLGLLATLVSTG